MKANSECMVNKPLTKVKLKNKRYEFIQKII